MEGVFERGQTVYLKESWCLTWGPDRCFDEDNPVTKDDEFMLRAAKGEPMTFIDVWVLPEWLFEKYCGVWPTASLVSIGSFEEGDYLSIHIPCEALTETYSRIGMLRPPHPINTRTM
jgi:hypothetical protein